MCSCQLNHFLGVDVSCQVWTLCKAFRKWNCFGDDVVAEQPPHPCLVVHDAMSHVTPCVFLSSEPWLKQCSFAWSKRNLSIHNCALIVRTMILPTVHHVLSAAPAPTHALCLLEKNITQFLWDGPDGNRRRPMVDCATLARPHIHGGLNCPLVKHIADSRRVALWTRALYSTENWACALKK